MFIPFIIFFISSMLTVAGIPSNKELLRQGRLHTKDDTGGSDVGRVNTLEPVFVKCCDIGNTWADEKRPCEVLISPPVSGVPANLQTPCLVTAGICCLRSARATMCEAGKLEAMEGKDCLRSVEPGGEYRKDCCDACKIGLMTGSRGEPCHFKTFAFEHPWNDGFSYCCQIAKRAGDGLLPDLIDNEVEKSRCATGNPCEHTCKDTGYTFECSCNPGYKLGADFRSCDDIDECEAKLDLCDIESQQCVNSEGSYFCLNADGSQDHPRLRTQYSSLEAGRTTFKPGHLPQTQLTNLGLCAKGYQYDPAAGSCVDIDECAEGYDFCNKDREVCINSAGAYDCQPKKRTTCPAGYKFNPTIVSCEDVNECEESLHDCNEPAEQCRNTDGGYECDVACQKGFQFHPVARTCLDVDECEKGLHNCTSVEECVNNAGSYTCYPKLTAHECPAGYKPGRSPGSCKDVNECEEKLDSCDETIEICVNEIGRYRCEPRTAQGIECATGYRFDPRQNECADVDECEENIHDCDLDIGACVNTQGGFRCQILPCTRGLRMSAETGTCEDIDECAEHSHNCSSQTSECVNTHGSFECRSLFTRSCLPGFRFNPAVQTCQDINECLENSHSCNLELEVCVNAIGSFTCQQLKCPPGFEANVASRKCEDINECASGNHNCPEECVNTMGGYFCKAAEIDACPPGNRFNAHARRCEDIIECLEGLQTCNPDSEICVNTVGSYLCRALVCPGGYRANLQARACMDINECEENLHNCTDTQECINRNGGFYCQTAIVRSCSAGYRYNATLRSCEDIDECLEHLHNCPADSYICANTRGNFNCLIRCETGLTNDRTDPRRCIGS